MTYYLVWYRLIFPESEIKASIYVTEGAWYKEALQHFVWKEAGTWCAEIIGEPQKLRWGPNE